MAAISSQLDGLVHHAMRPEAYGTVGEFAQSPTP